MEARYPAQLDHLKVSLNDMLKEIRHQGDARIHRLLDRIGMGSIQFVINVSIDLF